MINDENTKEPGGADSSADVVEASPEESSKDTAKETAEEAADEPAKAKSPAKPAMSKRASSKGPVKKASDKSFGKDSKKASDSEEEEDDDGEVVFTSNDAQPFTDDPLGEAYDLECGTRLGDQSDATQLPWQTDVGSVKEFFSAEILYRYDILEEQEQRNLDGSYRIELKGQEQGTWTVHLENELKVVNAREDADIVISMAQKDFLNLINGRLNPQLAILAKKMKVSGDIRRALAFQYILTPIPE